MPAEITNQKALYQKGGGGGLQGQTCSKKNLEFLIFFLT